MPVFQYKCGDCAAIFEYLISSKFPVDLNCIACGSSKVVKAATTSFYPNKIFCPHDKVLDVEVLKTRLSGIQADASQKCGGCGTDGAPGKCNSKGSGRGEGGCGGNCSCRKNNGSNLIPTEKLNLNVYEKKPF